MSDPMTATRRLRFAHFEFDRQTGELRQDGAIVDLPPQPTRVLSLLLARAGELVTRDALREHLWPDTIVEFDHGLNTCIRQIRDALGEEAAAPRYIQTVPRRGYRFIAALEPEADAGRAATPIPRRRTPVLLGIAGLLTTALLLAVAAVNAPHPGRRVAVMPFQNLTPHTLTPAFVDGLSEELMVALARYEPADVAVISRTSASRFADGTHSTREMARALRVTHVVQGTVRARGDTVVVTATLIRADDELAVWSARFASADLDPMTQMAPLGGRIASAMVGTLAPGDRPVTARSSTIPEARAALLRGRYLLARSDAAGAEEQLRQAVRLDPEYGLAFALLARARLERGDFEGATKSASRARALDPNLPEVHEALGDVAVQAQWDWERALDEFRQALTLAPGDAELHQRYAFVLALVGRPDASISESQLALDLDPVSPLVNGDVAWLYFYARRYAEAAKQARATLALNPDNAAAWYCLLMALESAGQRAEAHPIAAQVAERYGAPPQVAEAIRRGSPAEALDRFWRWDLEQMRRNGLASRFPLDFAAAFARFQQPDSAFSYIDRSVKSHVPFAATLAIDPRFDRLRGDPRFASVLAGIGLPARAAGRM